MPIRFPIRSLASLALVVALAGCSQSPTSPAPVNNGSLDRAAVSAALAADPQFASDSLLDVGTDPTLFSAGRVGAMPKAQARPRMWWRSITSSTATFTVVFADSDSTGRPRRADVTVTRHLLGTFNFYQPLANDSMQLDSANVIHKPLDETWVRHLRLRRLPVPGTNVRAWFVTGASAAVSTSNPATEQILSVRLQATNVDTTITDPAALWSVGQHAHVAPGDSVTITATTTHTDDQVFCYWHDRRERFTSNGDGTYTFKLRLPPMETVRWRFLGVNAISHGTMFDDLAPYDSQAWVLFCRVGGPPPPNEHF